VKPRQGRLLVLSERSDTPSSQLRRSTTRILDPRGRIDRDVPLHQPPLRRPVPFLLTARNASPADSQICSVSSKEGNDG
jgi:hypothetical protein